MRNEKFSSLRITHYALRIETRDGEEKCLNLTLRDARKFGL